MTRPFRRITVAVHDRARSLLTSSSVIPVMPVCMVMVPNPGGRNGRPVHCDGGIHYVWPFNFGRWLAVVMAFAITPHIPRKKKEPTEQHHQVLPDKFPKFAAGILRIQNKGPTQYFQFFPHNSLQFNFVVRPNVGRSPRPCSWERATAGRAAVIPRRKNLRTARRSLPTIGE